MRTQITAVSILRRFIAGAFLLAAVVSGTATAHAQFVLNETFSHSTFDVSGWDVNSWNNSFAPVLTASTAGGNIDANGQGWLRMTNNVGSEATYARLTTPIPSANNNISVDLKYQMWTNQGTGADGFTISLRDASKTWDVGAFGGSLGYAQKDGTSDQLHAGMSGGYFSVGVDAYGNFSNPTEGRVGGPGAQPNAVAVRGPGSGTGTTYQYTDANGNLVTAANYNYLGGTGNLSGTGYNLGTVNFTNVQGTTRPVDANSANDREIVFNFTTNNILTVSMRFGATGTLTQVIQTDLTNAGIRPENLELVFTAGTGGLYQTTEIKGLSITTSGAPVGTIYYSNYAGDNKWGNGNNWGNSATPNLGVVPDAHANLVFSNHAFTTPAFQLTTAQNVDLGANRSAGSIQFDAPFNYTLQGYTLTLDSGSATTPTAITVTSAAAGGAHTIQSALSLASDLNINTNTGTALNLSGPIAAGAHTFTLNNLGTTTISGQITGSGTMTQTAGSTGTTVLTGNSSGTYTGNIVVQDGTVRLGNDNILSSATNVSLSSANSFGTFDLGNHNQTLGGINFVSGGLVQTGAGTLTLAGDVSSQASATTATIAGNLNLGAASRTFNVADGGVSPDMAITANISGTGGINKTGNGSLTLNGLNSHTGSNTLAAGTTIAASDSALGSGTSTVNSGATLALQGGINLNSGPITVSGTGYTGSNGAIDNTTGNNALLSNVTLAGNTKIGAANGTQLTLSGNIGQSVTSALTAAGTGTVVLSGANSYTGTTTVNNGATLVVASNNALGTNAAGTTVSSGGTLAFQGGVNYTTTEAVTAAGTGAAGANGAIDNISGDNTFAGTLNLAGATTIGANSGTSLTLSGAISGANSLTAGGSGTVTLAGANTYSGATTVTTGATLIAASNNALGNTGTNTTTTVTNGGTLGFQGGVTISNENITLNGSGVGGGGALMNFAGNTTVTNQVTLASSSSIAAAAGSTLTLNGGITDGASTFNLTKSDAGKVVLAGASTYNGTTTITGGTLSLAGGGTIGSASNITVTNGTLELDNSGTNNAARISNTAPIALNDGTIRFVGNGAATSSEAFGTVTATTGANTIYLQAGASQHADLTIANLAQNGSSTITFSTDPTATLGGGTTNAGLLGSPRVFLGQINGTATTGSLTTPTALAGWILVSDVNGAANFAEYTGGAGTGNGVRALTSYYTGSLGINVNDPTKSVLLTSASPVGAYTLTNSGTTTDANLKITDAALVNLNTTTNRILQLNSGGLIKSGATSTIMSGAGQLTTANGGTLAVTVDNAGGSLEISSNIINNLNRTGNPINLTKSGAGLLVLSGANTFSGGVNINEGTLRINAETGLGNATVAKTITFNGGTLNVTTGFSANTAKTWTIGANGTGTFDINSAQTLSLLGTGDLTASTTSQLIKAGTGTLTLGAANTGFAGSALVNAGTLELDNANSLGTGRMITLNGGTLALENNATTTFANNITVTADSTITTNRTSGTGTNITLSAGTLAIGTNTLTVTGGNFYDMKLGAVTVTGDAVLNPNVAGSDLTVGAVAGSGSITKNGAANLTYTAASTYTGATTVNAGTLFTQGTNFLPTTTALTIADGATVDTGNFSQTIASLAGGTTGTAAFNLGTGALTVGDASNTSFAGTITASGFTKTGTGTLTLGGNTSNVISTFSVADGTIVAAKSAGDATGTGALTIGDGTGAANSAVLRLAAANQINDGSAVTINSDGKLDLNNNNETIGSLAGSGAVTLGTGTLTLAANTTSTYSGAISGTGGLVKSGTGTLTLTGASSYSGTTAINQGTVVAGSSTALGAGSRAVTVANAAGLELQNNVNITGATLSIIGTGASGNGALRNTSGDNTWGGLVSLGGAANINVSSGNLYLNGGINTAGNTLTISGSGNTQAVGAITGSGNIIKNGIGALVLGSSGNSYTGTTTVNAGSLQINANGAGPGSSAITLAASGTTLNVNNYSATIASLSGVDGSFVTLGSGSLTTGGANTSTTFSGAITGSGGSFTKTGTGTLTLGGTAANSLNGAFNVNDGTVLLNKTAGLDATGSGTLTIGDGTGTAGSAVVQLNAANQINDGVAVTINADGKLNLNGNTERIGSLSGATNSAVTLGTGSLITGGNNASTTFAGTISGSGGLTKEGTGTLTLGSTNSFTGGTLVSAGTLALAASNAISTSANLTISSGATVSFGAGISQTVAGLTTNSTSTINLGANAKLTVNTASASTLLGTVSGTGTLAYNGGGNLTVANSLNFGGTLEFGGTTIGSTPTTTLYLSGTVNLGTLKITGDTVLDFGNSAATTLNVGTFNIASGVKVSVVNWVNMSDYFITQNFNLVSGTTYTPAVQDQRGGTPENQVTFSGYTNNNTSWTSWDHEITPAPEPSTYGLFFVAGALGFVGFRRWRSRRTSERRS